MKLKNDSQKLNKILIKSDNLFPVVGIGASAGGLDAFKKLIKAIPENSGMAYVLVQHLDPKHESLLPELLQKVTQLPVLEITDDIKVLPNHIYIIPSNKMLVANDGVLELSKRPDKSKNQRNLPIDLFFTSLAEIHQSHAIGVVLSGTASDGTVGLKIIKDHGGITFAQDEESAAYESMPHSAAQAGVVDFILPPEKIPEKILAVLNRMNHSGSEDETETQKEEAIFKKILSLLRIRKGTDFTYYKQTTIRRRILRRMALEKNRNPVDYLKFLESSKAEQDVLYQDLLIPVTSFFRNANVFDKLCETIFPALLKNKPDFEPIRVWVAGCSSGQEAYSIAICLREFLAAKGIENDGKIPQIFATDLSEIAIAKARTGLYSKNELDGLTTERIQEFFTKTSMGYLLKKVIRDMCVFAVHNFLKDPPFGKIDFASCRNVLIYMEPYLQKKAMTMFHYALNSKGYLLLGKSETSGTVPDLFTLSAKNEKIFIRKDAPAKFMHVASQRIEKSMLTNNTTTGNEKMLTDYKKTADDIMLSKYTPAGVVVNDAMDIVHFRGNNTNYLEQAPGKPSHNILQMAKNGLAFEIRNILHKAKKQNATVIKQNIPLLVNGLQHIIDIEAIPLLNFVEPHFLILFHDNQLARVSNVSGVGKNVVKKLKTDEKDLQIQQLEAEIAQNREDMRSITEDQEAANEELQSANEELLSSSEELQSLNEELETSKEELQSTNEELTVLNQELGSLNEQVTEASHYSESIVDTVREPLLILDQHLRVKTANESFYATFKVKPENTEGVLVYDLGNKQWNIPMLRVLLTEIVPQNKSFKDFEITLNFPGIGERIMLLNAREIVREKSPEKLILLAFEDITERKNTEGEKDEQNAVFRKLVKDIPAAVYSCDTNGYINFYNHAAEKIWGQKPVIGKDLWCGSWKIFESDGTPVPLDKCPMAVAIKERRSVKSTELIIERKDNSRSYILVHPQAEFDNNGIFTGAVNFAFDITEQVLARKAAEEIEAFSRTILENNPDCVKLLDSEGRLGYMNKNGQCLMEIDDFSKFKNKYWWDLWEDENKQQIKNAVESAKSGKKTQLQLLGATTKGVKKWWDIIVSPMQEIGGREQLPQIISISRDITEQKNQQVKEQELLNRFQNLVLQSPVAILVLSGKNYVVDIANNTYLNLVEKDKKFIGKPIFDSLPELKNQGIKELLDNVWQTGEPFHGNEIEVKLVRNKNPETGFYNFTYQPIKNSEGEVTDIITVANEVTEQVAFRKKIEESEFRYQNMIAASPSLILILKGENLTIEVANDSMIEKLGKGRDIIGKQILTIAPELIEQGLAKMLEEVYRTGNPAYGNELPVFLFRNGVKELSYFTFGFQAQRNVHGKIDGVAVIAQVVTTEALLNNKIKASEAQFRMLVLQAPVAICVLRGENYIIEVINESMAEMWNRKQQDILDKPAFDVLPELLDQGFKQLLDNVYNNGERFVAEELPINLQRNGQLENAFVKFIYEPLREADGSISGVMALAHEITEQVVGRKKIEAQVLLHENMLMTAPGFVCTLVGPTHIYDLVNDRYQLMFGDRELKGKSILEALPELEGQGFDVLLDEVYTTGKPYVGIDIPIVLARGKGAEPETGYYNFSYQPMYNEYNEIYAILVFGYEVTEQVIAKNKNVAAVQKDKKELEEKVLLRTLELSTANQLLQQRNKEKEKQGARLIILNKELNYQNKEIEKRSEELIILNKELVFQNEEKRKREAELFIANKELSFQNEEKEKRSIELANANKELHSFNYISSHDLQEPLRKIQTFSSRILESEYANLSERGKDSFVRMNNAALRMRLLIDDLLAFSRISSDERKFEKTDLTKIIEQVVIDLKEMIEEKQATIEIEQLCDAKIIPFQFHQLFYNLLSNALKFAKPNEPVDIKISSHIEKGNKIKNKNLLPEKNYCHISVQDNGIGFQPEFREHIFGVFQKLHGKDQFAGSGIGLAIVKKIVENHSGVITATGELNKGATFDIYILSE
jgi:two-component system, chemotaxis family, CheB/CheR fusion protein